MLRYRSVGLLVKREPIAYPNHVLYHSPPVQRIGYMGRRVANTRFQLHVEGYSSMSAFQVRHRELQLFLWENIHGG